MSELPFTLSPEAIACIKQSLDLGPGCSGLVPTLQHWMSSESRSSDGTILSRFRGESLGVGWHTPEVAENGNYSRLELCGHMVVIHKETLKDLTGKRIVVEMLEVGVPSPASKKEEMLRAV